ncbi:MAG: DUF222 domain-containing protein [Pseudolysinimonas sp.]
MPKVLVSVLNDEDADVRLEFGLARAEVAQHAAALAVAARFAAIEATLREARDHPELYLSAAFRGNDASEFAERSAAADLAMRLRMSESSVRNEAMRAGILRASLPTIWAAFRDGNVAPSNAQAAADFASTLPEGGARTAFDDALFVAAQTLAPPRFRERARRVRDELDDTPAAERHAAAVAGRRIWLENDRDGMCWMTAHLAASDGHRVMARLDAMAAHLAEAADEQRTLGQLRADVAVDLLLSGAAATVPTVSVTVAVTVPILTLLGAAELPGTLEGYGPIDADTARRLAAHAPSFQRILTHPITGTILDIDRRSYRPPADLKRWLGLRDEHCTFAGCGRRAADCDLDHRVAWVDGGRTSVENLAHLCRHHHRLKHEGGWRSEQASNGASRWTSPTGAVHDPDPPPF